MSLILGCIADDITGATDLALMLAKKGMPVVQYIGQPSPNDPPPDSEAVVVALKSRTAPVEKALSESLAACRWLTDHGARQIFFKYCSTFDSTAKGNIGPVAQALLQELGEPYTVFCPSLPVNGRTVYQGHLFVFDRLLSESSMRNHPLTPMTDSDLVKFLGKQVDKADAVGLLPLQVAEQGFEAVSNQLAELADSGKHFLVTDAVNDRHLRILGKASAGLKLLTGGSGLAMGLPDNFRAQGLLKQKSGLVDLPALTGSGVVLAGSCSAATQAQVVHAAQTMPTRQIDPLELAKDSSELGRALDWAQQNMEQGPFLIYSTADPQRVCQAQEALGREQAGELVERALAQIAVKLHEKGLSKLVVAGGETSGAVMAALNVKALGIGPEIEPGVPWTLSTGQPPLLLALKSGNFGGEDFFSKALEMLP